MLQIKVNATTANLCIGFDTIGMALDVANEFIFEVAVKFSFQGFLPAYCNEDNLVKTSYEYVFQKAEREILPQKITLVNRIPISRGMGSSSTLIVAGVYAANYYLGNIYTKEECFQICIELEGHPDNVAPAIFGGFVASYKTNKGIQYKSYPVHEDLWFVVISPKEELSTKKAREVLPKMLPYDKIVSNLSRIIHLPYALAEGDLDLLNDLFLDELHEPYRLPLIRRGKEYREIAKRLKLPFCISGSGSSMLLICKDLSCLAEFTLYGEEIRILKLGEKMEVRKDA